jgi:hypothetical protein
MVLFCTFFIYIGGWTVSTSYFILQHYTALSMEQSRHDKVSSRSNQFEYPGCRG